MRKVTSLFFLLLVMLMLHAQQRVITGKVVDDKGNPVANATISVKGTSTLVMSGDDGSFTVPVAVNSKTLVVSYVGMADREISIGSSNSVTVALTQTGRDLQEVVVVGYGTKTVREISGAMSKVSGAKVAAEPVSSFQQALAGKTAGVQISLGTGVLADRTAIRVRGINSISSSSQPLIVIDGIPQNPATNLNGFNSGNGTRFDPLSMVNPNDIESIDVLKDAGASVIYGSRASNGVILITTKKGRKGSVKTTIDSKAGWAVASKTPDLLNASEFISITNEKGANRFGANSAYANMARVSDIDGDGHNDETNWNDMIYRTAFTTDNTISLSGGAEKLSFYGSARFLKQEGITIGNRLTTGQTRLNIDVSPKNWFKSGLQIAYNKTKNNGILSDGFIAGTSVSGWMAPPNVSVQNPSHITGYNLTANGLLGLGNNVTSVNGVSFLPNASYFNNVVPTIKFSRNDNTADDIRANIYGEIQPVRNVKLTSKFGMQNISNFEDQYSPPFINGLGSAYNGLIQNMRRFFEQWVWQNYANYDFTLNNVHKIGLTAGTEYQKNLFRFSYNGAANFTDPFYVHVVTGAYTNSLPNSTSVLDLTDGNINENASISYFGRASYTFASKYFVEGSLRRDGFSGFGAGYQFGTFPSISLGWDVTREGFLNDVAWLNHLKIRGSYGTVGNSNGVGNYGSLTLFGGASYTSLNGLRITQAGNQDLRWEKSTKTNIGFDANLWNNRVNIVADYFVNDINDLILQAPTLHTVGIPLSSITTNTGGMYNKGIELTLNATPYTSKSFNWTTSFNFTRIKNRVTGLIPTNNHADLTSSIAVASVDKPLGTFFLPRWAGVDAATGNPMWYAKNGSIKRYNFGATGANLWTDDKGTPVAALGTADYVYLDKSGLPNFYGGWDNTFSYKAFDLNIAAVYQGGNYIYNASKSSMLSNQFTNNFSSILDRWQKPGDNTDVPRLWLNDNTANQSSTRFLEKGDFLRIRTITLGYNFERNILNKIGVDGARFYVQAFNPLVFTKYSGLDPDVSTNGTSQNNIALGLDNRATPQFRSTTIGINITF